MLNWQAKYEAHRELQHFSWTENNNETFSFGNVFSFPEVHGKT